MDSLPLGLEDGNSRFALSNRSTNLPQMAYAYELAAFIGTLATIITRELIHNDHILSKWGEFTREMKDENLFTWFVYKYTTCEICLSGMLGCLSAFILAYLGQPVFTVLPIPVYAMLTAGVVRRYVF